MRDEIFDREYQEGRDAMNAGIDRTVLAIGRGIASTFQTLHDIQFDAPWQKSSPPAKLAKPVKARRRAGIA